MSGVRVSMEKGSRTKASSCVFVAATASLSWLA